jgi:hypothetical protein
MKVAERLTHERDRVRFARANDEQFRAARACGRNAGTMLCVPARPEPHSAVAKIAAHLGLALTAAPDMDAVPRVLAWDKATIRPGPIAMAGRDVVNGRCVDISKSTVCRVFADVFGYPLAVDPAVHIGPAVEKPEINAAHAGRVVTCPTAARPGYSYQVVVNNTDGPDVVDIRVPVLGGTIPLLYVKQRPVTDRFSNTNRTAALVRHPSAMLTCEEVAGIVSMCQQMSVDYAELDCLRDVDSGRMYVVDVNPTPWGPPNGLPEADSREAVAVMADVFGVALLRYVQAAKPPGARTATTG